MSEWGFPGLRKELIYGSGWAFSGFIVSVLSGLGTNVILARLLTPEELGSYFLAVSLVAAGAVGGRLGLHRTVIRAVSGSLAQGGAVRDTVYGIHTLALFGAVSWGAASAAAVWALSLAVFQASLIGDIILPISFLIAIEAYRLVLSETIRGFGDLPRATAYGDAGRGLLYVTFVAALLASRGSIDLPQALAVSALAGLAVIGLAGGNVLDRVKRLRTDEAPVSRLRLLSSTWPIMVTELLQVAMAQLDIWVLGAHVPASDLAIYGAAGRLAILVRTPLLVVNAVILPYLAPLHLGGERARLEHLLRVSAGLASLPVVMMTAVLVFFGGSLLGWVYGPYYSEGGTVLAILAVAQLLNVLGGSNVIVLIMGAHQHALMRVIAFSTLFLVAAAVYAARKYGIVGVAIASMLAITLQNGFLVYVARRLMGVWTMPSLHAVILTWRRGRV